VGCPSTRWQAGGQRCFTIYSPRHGPAIAGNGLLGTGSAMDGRSRGWRGPFGGPVRQCGMPHRFFATTYLRHALLCH
jgi:hypothetical protein